MARLRHAASLVRGTGFPPDSQGQVDGDLPFFKVGDFSNTGNETYLAQCDNWISEATASRLRARPVPEGTVLLPKIGAAMLLGSRRITTRRSVFDNNVLGIVPSNVDERYLRYWLVTVDLRPLANPGPVPSLDDDALLDLALPLSGRSRQRAIADYLDAETARIDALVATLTVANALLDAWLDTQIDSLVWSATEDVVPLMRLCSDDRKIQYGIVLPGPDVDDGVPIVKGGDLLSGALRGEGLAKTTYEIEAGFARSRLQVGDVAFAIRGAVGACAMVPSDVAGANITQDVAMIAHTEHVDPTWLWFALRSHAVQRQAEARILGATIKGINIRDLKRLKLPRLDFRLQREIASELVLAQSHHDNLLAARSSQINLMKERRQALITAAVTGQIEIPGVAA
jgi:type I restriction enzyme S subunit